MKNYRFHEDGFSLITFFDMRGIKIEITSSCLPRRAGSSHVLFDLDSSISKSDFRSGQVRSGQGHDPSRSICISSEAG